MKQSTKGILYIVLSSISFGIIPILAKLSYSQGGNPFNVLFLRFMSAAIMIFLYLKIKGISLKIEKKQFVLLMIFGILGYSGTALCLFLSYNYIAAGLATMILYLYPSIVTILSFIIYGEKFYRKKIVSLIVSLLGVYLLIGFTGGSLINIQGLILALLASLFYSIYVLGLSNKEISSVNSFVITYYVSLASSITMLLAGSINKSISFNISLYGFLCIILLAFISTVIALITFVQGVKIIGPSNASIFSNLEPIVSMVLSYLIFRDKITPNTILGSFFIMLSILILSVDKKQILKLLSKKDNAV
ncbi:DMT family transporter [Clostridium omnivorum]|uniref:Membrane protein n=1 Tax=Clostridium omnivorum TaxID=1604902 RepID=A0ABQ5N0H0_9CLOT|nr:DMT family transporter [Clostridium sp. E14]GLC28668.1 membrane protein [Clostridium sp. E14]